MTQAYCAAPGRGPENNAALASLFTVGIIYIGWIFLHSLWNALRERHQRLSAEPRRVQRYVSIAMFVAFTALFLWELWLVMHPILQGLCVYR